ncbi:olfactory receptor 8G17-like [Salvelinus sp. IW2-2015]|uniref:olfactory receptor 8G17-like n=1 Tax=Salvelinus sp. IW2-2015 TaxID=2691554 RepID=UPI000CDFA4C8|nr:olfactory receptor 146-like [Salvelinus alpinus]
MENHTFSMDLLKLEGVKVIYQSTYPAFILLLVIYIFTMVANIGLTVLICMERSLHQPMYILLCNMSFNDALSITTIIPRVLFDILTPRSDRYITYNECFTQAFLGHWFGSNFHTILMIMAFDRYVAICNPLRYATIMNNRMLVKLCVFAWVVSLVFVAVLLGLTLRLSRCRSEIINPWCDNASLFKLSCESVLINNIYGLFFTTIFFITSMGSVALTYIRITMVCVRSKSKSLNSKALHTCFTHLAVYLIMLMTGFIIVFLHRYPQWSDHRKLASIMFYVVPPALNPIIYGLQSKDIRKLVVNISHCKKVSPLV